MNIINHLRTFSRQSKGEFSRLNMNKVIKGSLTLINEQLRLHNIEVTEAYASDLPPVQGNETQIEQVIINLITNARDAIDRREANSEGDDNTKKKLRILTSKARDDSHVEIRITDSGEGIPPGDLDRIFDPFFTTKEVGKGTGLGLSISYGIIKDHGGGIEVTETGRRELHLGYRFRSAQKPALHDWVTFWIVNQDSQFFLDHGIPLYPNPKNSKIVTYK